MPGPCPDNTTLNNCLTGGSPARLLFSGDGGRHWKEVSLPAAG